MQPAENFEANRYVAWLIFSLKRHAIRDSCPKCFELKEMDGKGREIAKEGVNDLSGKGLQEMKVNV